MQKGFEQVSLCSAQDTDVEALLEKGGLKAAWIHVYLEAP